MIHNLKTLLPAMSTEEIQKACPQAFAEAPTNTLSKRYVFHSTATIIQDMEKLGWVVVSAQQRKAQKNKTSRFSPHMIVFQNPEVKISSEDEKLAVSAILFNSHDGTLPVTFRMGIFRAACSNGLVTAETEYTSFKIKHVKYTFEELQAKMREFLDVIPSQVDVINKMVQTELTESQQMDLALKALLLRTGVDTESVETPIYSEETLKEVLKPRRLLDTGNSLWLTLNRVQEAITIGGFQAETENGKFRMLSPVKSFEKDYRMNEQLFEAALEYVN